MTKTMRTIIEDCAKTGDTIFDASTKEDLEESIRILKNAGVSKERIRQDLETLLGVDVALMTRE